MFSAEMIKTLNELEMLTEVILNTKRIFSIPYMASPISPTLQTILRRLQKP